jgi:nitrate reductase gamma subunit
MSLSNFLAILFYVSVAFFLAGVGYKIFQYQRTPSPLKIPLTPAPTTKWGVVVRLLKEVAFFESLFRSNKWTWLFGWIFHVSLFLVVIRHLRYFLDPVWMPVLWVQPVGVYAGYTLVLSLFALLGRRVLVQRVRYISTPSDYLMLIFLILIGASGLFLNLVVHTDIVAVKIFFRGLLSFSVEALPGDLGLLVHLILASFLLVIFPISKLLHAPGIFFSPSRNMTDNPREARHVSSWASVLDK